MTTRSYKVIVVVLTIILLSQISYQAFSQVTADFKVDITSGCSPLVVQFTNLSTGPITAQHWNFGNGNTSSQPSPGAIYITPGCFNVRLIVTDGVTYDTMIKPCYVTVFQDPKAFLLADDTAGCIPFSVNFTDSSIAGSAGITNWVWDFGDGNISTQKNPSHNYTEPDVYNVTLLVTDANGCSNSLIKTGYINAGDYPKAGFTADSNSSCTPPLTVNFQDTSSSLFSMTYHWDFGDSDTSSAQNPSHLYSGLGNYDVSLKVINSIGCSDSVTYTNFINIQDISVDFASNVQQACVGEPIQFNDLTVPTANSFSWNFGDGSFSNSANPTHVYATAGTYNVTLTASSSGICSGAEVKTNYIIINASPAADFSADSTESCLIPHTVNFIDNSMNSVSWFWDFGDGDTSTQQNPSHTYTASGDFDVSLTITNVEGCSGQLTKSDFIQLNPPEVNFDASPRYGCLPRTVDFADSTIIADPIVSWFWDFGDGNTSTLQNPSNDYTNAGSYHVSLTIQTASGCVGTLLDSNFIGGGNRPVTAFTATPLNACIYDPVGFFNTTPNANQWYWDFGDGGTSDEFEPTHTYADTGYFTITLITRENGCADTLEIPDYVHISPPDAIFSFSHNCSNPSQVIFTDNSLGPDTWAWDFGDGNTSTLKNPTHTYALPGTYTVTLTVTNSSSGCFDVASSNVVVTNPVADFHASPLTGCRSLTVAFTDSSNDAVSRSWSTGGMSSTSKNPSFNYTTPGTYNVRLIITDVNGCTDTMLKTNYITVLGPTTNFRGTPTDGCSPLTVNFTDSSFSHLSSVVDWKWYFGDGDSSSLQNPVHTYNVTGTYNVTLITTDGNGCKNTLVKNKYIKPTFPIPAFTADTLSCTSYNVQFVNNSVGSSMSFSWDFGDSTTSVATNPKHVYTQEGVYTVALTVTDANGCDSTLVKPNYVRVSNPKANLIADNTFSPCPPLLVNFRDTSAGNVSTWKWNFGDGTSSNLKNPSHVYLSPGNFDVSLIITNSLGCKDTTTKDDLIVLLGPNGTFDFNPKEECLDNDIFFSAVTYNTVSRIWDFGDGTVMGGLDTITHTYTTTGYYHPSIILNDGLGCIFSVKSKDSVTIGNIITDFKATDTSPCPNQLIQFTDLSSAFPTKTGWFWDFGDSTTSTLQNPSHFYTNPGFYDIMLVVSNGICSDTLIKPSYVFVDPWPIADFTSPAKGCTPVAVQFQDNTQSDSLVTSWVWDFGDGTGDTVQNASHTYLGTGNFDIRLIVTSINTCKDTAVKTIEVYNLPVVSAGPDTSICHTTPVQLSGSGGIQFSWSPATGLDDPNVAQPIATPDSSTSYVLTVTDSNTCQNTDTMNLTIHPLPIADVMEDQEICIGNTVELWATGGVDYSWTPSAGLNCATCSNPIASPDSTITYAVIVSTSFKCTDSDTVTVTVHERPIGITSADTAICIGKDAQLTSEGGVLYAWYPYNSLDCSDCPNPVATPDSTTDYSLLVYNQYNCETYDTVKVTINPLPVIEIVADTKLCRGASTNINARGGVVYAWTPSTALSCDDCPNPVAQPDSNISYNLQVTSIFGCINNDSLTIEVFPLAAVHTAEDITICNGDKITLNTVYENVDTFSWSPAAGLDDPTAPNPIAGPTQTTTYTVNTFNGADCPSSDEVTVTVLDKVDVAVTDDIAICKGESAEFEGQIIAEGNLGTNVIWFPVNGISKPTELKQTVTPVNSITYYLVAYSGSCIPDTEDVHITVNPLPVVDAGQVQYVIEDYETTLDPSGSTNIATYDWSPADRVSCTDCKQPVAHVGTSDQYFHVTVVDENGCVSSDSMLIKVIGKCGEDIFVPNTFTPNGDDKNDKLFVRGRSIGELDYFRVFDRWGNLMYETKELGEGWDGLYNGRRLNPSVFVYSVEGVCKNGKQFSKKGNVTLIR